MTFAILALKIFLFLKQFTKLTLQESNGVRTTWLYVFKVHAKHWYTAPLSTSAPRLNLCLLRTLQSLSKVGSSWNTLEPTCSYLSFWYPNRDFYRGPGPHWRVLQPSNL